MIAHLNNTQKGILFAGLGYTSFAIADINAKWLVSDFHPLQIMNFQAAVALVILLSISRYIGGWKGWNNKKEMRIHIMRGFINFVVSLLVVSSFAFLSLAEVYAMIFAKPFLAVPLAMFIYGERVGVYRWACIVCGFIGVLMVLQPGFNMNPYLLMPLAGAAMVAVMFLSSRSLKEASPFILSFYPLLLSFVISTPLMIYYFNEPNLLQIGHFILGGALVTGGITFVSLAFRAIDASLVTPFLYTEMIWGLIFGYLIFGDVPNFWMIAGTAVIIASGLAVIIRQNNKAQKPEPSDTEDPSLT